MKNAFGEGPDMHCSAYIAIDDNCDWQGFYLDDELVMQGDNQDLTVLRALKYLVSKGIYVTDIQSARVDASEYTNFPDIIPWAWMEQMS